MPSSSKKPGKTGSRQKNQVVSIKLTASKSQKKAKKKSRRKSKKKKMNLPSRLARLLSYQTRKGIIRAGSTELQSCQNNPRTEVRKRELLNGESISTKRNLLTCKSPQAQRTLERNFGTDTNCDQKGPGDMSGGTDGNGERMIPQDKILALDCEMVGVGPGGKIGALARCSIVDYDGNVIYDSYIKPELKIYDYRTQWSGIHKHHMIRATPFGVAQQQIAKIIRGKIVVGHAIGSDFRVLKLHHPIADVRDTSVYKGLSELAGLRVSSNQRPGLKKLTMLLFGNSIQHGEHCSVEDAKATMSLYKLVDSCWEKERLSQSFDPDLKMTFMDDQFWPNDLD